MKFKIYVVDMEIPARVKTWATRIGILGLLLGSAAVAIAAATPLHTWATGDTLQATDLNGNFAALDQRISALASQVGSVDATVQYPLVGPRPPAGTKFAWQGGSFTGTTDASGVLSYAFPTAFPTGIVSVVITNGFAQHANGVSGITDSLTLSGFNVVANPNTLLRINWMALGW
jgi:hypothetical protein